MRRMRNRSARENERKSERVAERYIEGETDNGQSKIGITEQYRA